jgi:hypothetical protein
MKNAIIITIDDVSKGSVKEATDLFMKSLVKQKSSPDIRASVRISIYNPEHSEVKDYELSKFIRWFLNENNGHSKEPQFKTTGIIEEFRKSLFGDQ